jgi:thiol-disulfide isomerase/thioredoxin
MGEAEYLLGATSVLNMTSVRMMTLVVILLSGTADGQTIDLKFTSLDGRLVDVQALKGKIVLIDCWASWCAPCLKEMSCVKDLYNKYHNKGFEVIGISMDEALAKERVQQIVAQKDLPWPQRFQGSGFEEDTFRKLYQIKSLPAVFLLDQEGNIVDTDARGDRLEPLLKKYLGL